jgi:protein tyrosine/serine phosphatase
MNPTRNGSARQRNSAAASNDRLPGSGLGPRSAVLLTFLLLVAGTGGYLGYRTAMGRYAIVDPGRLYRSAEWAPSRLVEECRRLGIRTVVDFREDSSLVDAEAEALRAAGVTHARLPTGQVPPPEVVEAFLDIMSHEENLPVLIHCEHGVGRTGLHAALYRIEFQGWSGSRARWEAMLLAGFDSFQKGTDKARFLESYAPRLRQKRAVDSSTQSR